MYGVFKGPGIRGIELLLMLLEVCWDLLDFVFYYTQLVGIQAAFLLEKMAKATLVSCKKV